MTESTSAGFTPSPTYSTAPTPRATTTGSLHNAVSAWVKYATIALLGLAGIFWLLPQYEYVGEEYHIFLDYYDYYNLGSRNAGTGSIFIVWIFLIAAAASVWFIDKSDQPLGWVKWVPIPLILLAMIFVVGGQSTPQDTIPPVDDRNWTAFYWKGTSGHTIVWVGLWAALLGAAGALIYPRFSKPTPGATVVTAPGQPPVMPPPVHQPAPQPPPPSVEQRLAELTRLRDAGVLEEAEYQEKRRVIVSKL